MGHDPNLAKLQVGQVPGELQKIEAGVQLQITIQWTDFEATNIYMAPGLCVAFIVQPATSQYEWH